MYMSTGTLAWFELSTLNEANSMKFYKSVFNWDFKPMGDNYWAIVLEENMMGGLKKETASTFLKSQGFRPYFVVPSIKEAAAVISKNGGKLESEAVEIGGGHGFCQNFSDLDGNHHSIWSSKP